MGNPIRISEGGSVKTLSWGEGRMLLGVSKNASNYSQYTYDVDGLRTRKVVSVNGIRTTTEYAWCDNGLAGMIIRKGTATTTVVPHYDSEGEAIGFTVMGDPSRLPNPRTTNTYTYIKNLQGDVLRILDSNGNAVVNYTYDPWGKPTITGDEELAALNPCSYRGYDYDEETGYYYLQSRYYNPALGRFINPDDSVVLGAVYDELPQYNLYAYCNNNAMNRQDPSGCISFKAVMVAGIAGGLWSLIKYASKNLSNFKWKTGISKFAKGFLTGAFVTFAVQLPKGRAAGFIGAVFEVIDYVGEEISHMKGFTLSKLKKVLLSSKLLQRAVVGYSLGVSSNALRYGLFKMGFDIGKLEKGTLSAYNLITKLIDAVAKGKFTQFFSW